MSGTSPGCSSAYRTRLAHWALTGSFLNTLFKHALRSYQVEALLRADSGVAADPEARGGHRRLLGAVRWRWGLGLWAGPCNRASCGRQGHPLISVQAPVSLQVRAAAEETLESLSVCEKCSQVTCGMPLAPLRLWGAGCRQAGRHA